MFKLKNKNLGLFLMIAGNFIYALSQFGIVSMITKLSIKESLGYYTLSSSILSPIFLLFQLNFRSILATDIQNKFNYNSMKKISICIGVIALLFSTILISTIYSSKTLLLVTIFLGLSKIVEYVQEIGYGYYQKNAMINNIAFSKSLRGIFSMGLSYIVLITFNSIYYVTFSIFLSWLLVYIFYDKRFTILEKSILIPIKELFIQAKELIKIGLPLGISASLDSLIANVPRYFVTLFIGIKEVGYFSAMIYLMNMGQIIITSINQTFLTKLSYLLFNDFHKYKKLKNKLISLSLFFGTLVFIITFFGGDVILLILFDSSFVKYLNILQILMFAALIWYVSGILYVCLLATKKFNAQLYIYIISAIAMFFSLLILVPLYGMIGAAVGLIVTYAVRLVCSYIILMNLEKKIIRGET